VHRKFADLGSKPSLPLHTWERSNAQCTYIHHMHTNTHFDMQIWPSDPVHLFFSAFLRLFNVYLSHAWVQVNKESSFTIHQENANWQPDKVQFYLCVCARVRVRVCVHVNVHVQYVHAYVYLYMCVYVSQWLVTHRLSQQRYKRVYVCIGLCVFLFVCVFLPPAQTPKHHHISSLYNAQH